MRKTWLTQHGNTRKWQNASFALFRQSILTTELSIVRIHHHIKLGPDILHSGIHIKTIFIFFYFLSFLAQQKHKKQFLHNLKQVKTRVITNKIGKKTWGNRNSSDNLLTQTVLRTCTSVLPGTEFPQHPPLNRLHLQLCLITISLYHSFQLCMYLIHPNLQTNFIQ